MKNLGKSLAFIGLVALVMVLLPVSTDAQDCYHYENSMQGYVFGWGVVCMNTGPGCGECVEGASSCTYDGPEGSCDPTPENRT